MLEPKEARKKLQKAIEQAFLRIKEDHRGELERAAKEIGADRQQLQQYAKGTPAPADLLLMAFMKWGAAIRIEDERAKDGEPKWWEFSMSGRDGGLLKPRPKPVQLSLFEALDELQNDNVEVKVLRRKGVARLELGLEIGFKKVKF